MKIEAKFDSTRDAPQRARELVRAKLMDRVPATTLADVLTVVSELVANAAIHGAGREARLRLQVLDDAVTGEVANDGRSEIAYGEPDPENPRGLGLHVVNAIATTWGVEHGDGTVTVVFFEVAFP